MSNKQEGGFSSLVPGLILISFAAAGMGSANSSSVRPVYEALLHGHFLAGFPKVSLEWIINDILMCLFFLHVALDIKKEVGTSGKDALILPTIAAFGGVIVPSLIYALVNLGDSAAMRGWAIPSATDIAFSLAVLSLLGKRVPLALKLFLTTVAVADDLIAIVIIALFYGGTIEPYYLIGFILSAALLVIIGRTKYWTNTLAVCAGLILWFLVYNSGLHTTLAGVALGIAVPLSGLNRKITAEAWTNSIAPVVNFMVLPVFAFANSGLSLQGIDLSKLGQGIPLGVTLGLTLGKPLGLFGAAYLAIKLGFCRASEELSFPRLLGVSILGGIGFTMSLFVSHLAFSTGSATLADQARTGIFLGSLIAAVGGYLYLRLIFSPTLQNCNYTLLGLKPPNRLFIGEYYGTRR